MPKGRNPAMAGLVAVLMLAGLALWGCSQTSSSGPGPDKLAKQIHDYLGTNKGDPAKELIANIEKNNEYLRTVIEDLECDVYMLQNPGQPKPTPCPPQGGGKSPVAPPTYPP